MYFFKRLYGIRAKRSINPNFSSTPRNMADTTSSMSSTNISSSTTTGPSGIYYLHPSDNPGALITSVLLKGDNYTEWATELSNSIQAKQKLGSFKE